MYRLPPRPLAAALLAAALAARPLAAQDPAPLPPGVTLPPGVQLPPGVTFPPGVTLPPGVSLPGMETPAAPAPDAATVARAAAVVRRLAGPYAEAHAGAVADALAEAGVEVWADDRSRVAHAPGDPSGLRVLAFQARGMAVELASDGGRTAAEIDALAGSLPLPDGSEVAASALVEAYVAAAPSFGAELSRQLLAARAAEREAAGARRPEPVRYPALTLLLFVREFAVPALAVAEAGVDPGGYGDGGGEGEFDGDGFLSPEPAGRGPSAGDAPGVWFVALDPCADLSAFLDDLPDAVGRAVETFLGGGGEGAWGTVVSVFGFVTRSAASVARTAALEALRHSPFVEGLRRAANALGALTDVHAMLSQWALTVEPPGEQLHKTVDATVTGTFTLTVTPPGEGVTYPPEVRSCAALLDVDLPQLNDPDGAAVTWEQVAGFDDPAVEDDYDDEVEGGRATYTFETVEEDEELHERGAERTAAAEVRATLEVPGLRDLAGRLAGLMAGRLAQAGVTVAAGEIAERAGPSAAGAAPIGYHTDEEDARIRTATGVESLEAVSCGGTRGPWRGTLTYAPPGGGSGSTPVAWTFDDAGRAPVRWALQTRGGVLQVSMDIRQTLRLTSGERLIETSGSYTSVVRSPAGAHTVNGARAEGYTVERGFFPECDGG